MLVVNRNRHNLRLCAFVRLRGYADAKGVLSHDALRQAVESVAELDPGIGARLRSISGPEVELEHLMAQVDAWLELEAPPKSR